MENTIEIRQEFIKSRNISPLPKPYFTFKSLPEEDLIYCSYDNLQGTLFDFSMRKCYLIPQTEELTGRWDKQFSEIHTKNGEKIIIFNFNTSKKILLKEQLIELKKEAIQIVNEAIDLWITTEELDLTHIKPSFEILSKLPLYQLVITEITNRNLSIYPVDKTGLKFKVTNYLPNSFKQ